MTKPSYSSVLVLVILVLIVGCNRDETTKSSGNGKPSIPWQENMNDPEVIELDKAVRSNPISAEVYWRRASAWHARDRFDLAFPDYDEAIRLDPTNSAYFD